jgi:MFS family permease
MVNYWRVAGEFGGMVRLVCLLGLFAILCRGFFPKREPYAQLLNTAGIFAIGFLMRPIGGWLMGTFADKRGRKTALLFRFY